MNRLLRHLFPLRKARLARPQPARRRRAPLDLLALADRLTPNTYMVSVAGDSGTGSLRDAITQANGNSGADSITFDTAGLFATPQTISLLSALPVIGGDLTITGPGSAQLTVQR